MVNTERFQVRFWGVRGSYPTPGPQTIRYGGNTTCVEVAAGAHTLILDAGSGIIRLGKDLLSIFRALSGTVRHYAAGAMVLCSNAPADETSNHYHSFALRRLVDQGTTAVAN